MTCHDQTGTILTRLTLLHRRIGSSARRRRSWSSSGPSSMWRSTASASARSSGWSARPRRRATSTCPRRLSWRSSCASVVCSACTPRCARCSSCCDCARSTMASSSSWTRWAARSWWLGWVTLGIRVFSEHWVVTINSCKTASFFYNNTGFVLSSFHDLCPSSAN